MEVLPAMTDGAINVLTGPPIVAEQLQWASRVTDLNTETVAYVVGGLIASSARLQSLPPNLRQVMLARAAQSADRLNKTIRNIDAQAFARMKATKKIYEPTEAERQKWRAVFTTVAKQLRGAVFTPAVFDRVVQLAGNPLAL
jgi:TRAP-type C4-dicarboxylate transport system substrate-binding protein